MKKTKVQKFVEELNNRALPEEQQSFLFAADESCTGGDNKGCTNNNAIGCLNDNDKCTNYGAACAAGDNEQCKNFPKIETQVAHTDCKA